MNGLELEKMVRGCIEAKLKEISEEEINICLERIRQRLYSAAVEVVSKISSNIDVINDRRQMVISIRELRGDK